MRTRFIKNLYQNISFAICEIVFIIPIVVMFFMKRRTNPGENDILYLLLIALFVFLYFGVGFYWIFQTIEISAEGIKVMLCKKTIKKYEWEMITDIEYSNVMRNPVISITIAGGNVLNLDRRERIRVALCHYGDDRVKNIIDKLK